MTAGALGRATLSLAVVTSCAAPPDPSIPDPSVGSVGPPPSASSAWSPFPSASPTASASAFGLDEACVATCEIESTLCDAACSREREPGGCLRRCGSRRVGCKARCR